MLLEKKIAFSVYLCFCFTHFIYYSFSFFFIFRYLGRAEFGNALSVQKNLHLQITKALIARKNLA